MFGNSLVSPTALGATAAKSIPLEAVLIKSLLDFSVDSSIFLYLGVN
jgi:hypothetical protein